MCHHISTGLYNRLTLWKRDCAGTRQLSSSSEIQTKVEEWSLEEGTANVRTGFSCHTMLSDGRIVLITFSRQLILKYLRAGDDQYLQHPYQYLLHYHPFLTRHRQYMIHPSNSTTNFFKEVQSPPSRSLQIYAHTNLIIPFDANNFRTSVV